VASIPPKAGLDAPVSSTGQAPQVRHDRKTWLWTGSEQTVLNRILNKNRIYLKSFLKEGGFMESKLVRQAILFFVILFAWTAFILLACPK
jgi:hypothetical protein